MVIRSLLGSVVGSEPRIGEPARFLASIPGVRALSGTALRFFDALSSPQKAFEPLCCTTVTLSSCKRPTLPSCPSSRRVQPAQVRLEVRQMHANGAAVLASPTVYERTVDHDQTGLIYHSPTEFGMMLERLIRERPLRRRLARNAFQFVARDRMLARHYQARHEWYRGMLEQKGELTLRAKARARARYTVGGAVADCPGVRQGSGDSVATGLDPYNGQSESDETTSPPARVAIACQTSGLIEFLAKTTWPSQYRTSTPPGWLLRAAVQPGL